MKIKNSKKPKQATVSYSVYSHLPEIQRPSFANTLVFPENLTELETANISDLHGKYSLLYAFVNQDLARINVRILRLKTNESVLVNSISRSNRSLISVEKWKREIILNQDPDMENIHKYIAKLEQEKVYAEMYLSNYERYLNALSRELTRKTAEATKFGKHFVAQ